MSLNVNGLGNPIKRTKVMAKLNREKVHIIFLQETHLAQTEHEKLKQYDFKNTYYNSYVQSHKEGLQFLQLMGLSLNLTKK